MRAILKRDGLVLHLYQNLLICVCVCVCVYWGCKGVMCMWVMYGCVYLCEADKLGLPQVSVEI